MVYWSLLRTIQMAMDICIIWISRTFLYLSIWIFRIFERPKKMREIQFTQILILLEISPFLTFFMLFRAWTVLRQKKFPFHSGLYGRKKAGEKSRELCTMSKGAFVHIQSPPHLLRKRYKLKHSFFITSDLQMR